MRFSTLIPAVLLTSSVSALPSLNDISLRAEQPQTLDTRQSNYLDIANTWRRNQNLRTFSGSSQLESNALKTAVNGNGQLVHQLNAGSFAQNLAYGNAGNFIDVWYYWGTFQGNAEIMKNPGYTKLGCGFSKGVWVCDFA